MTSYSQFGKIYIGSSLYLDGNAIANAIADEELGILRDTTNTATTIITSIPNNQHFVVLNTAGMFNGDTLTQGTDPLRQHTTTIVSVVDSTHLTVVSTLGFSTAVTYTDLANRIIFDKTVLAATLSTFGVPSSPSEELIALVDKVLPLNINFIVSPPQEHFLTPITTTITSGTGDVVTFFATEALEFLNEIISDLTLTSTVTFNGNILSGGSATDTTHNIPFTILALDTTYTPPRMFVTTTSGMFIGDTLQQGVNSTSILGVVDSTHLSVSSVSGFTADSVLSTFTG
jgi:hypothetical protein